MKKVYNLLILILAFNQFVVAQNVEIQGNASITGQLELMDTIQFSDGTMLASACLSILQDADGDTRIEVESSPDEDVIRLISGGQTVMVIDQKNLTITHNGNSMFIGDQAGAKDDGNNGNIFIGNSAGKNNTFGSKNIYIGTNAAQSNQNGTQNVYIGEEAGGEESGANNTFLGAFSGFNNFGNQNTMVGHQSGESLSGSRNTILGASAGANASGDGNVIIGSDAGKSAVGDNQLIIHNTDSNTPLISGRFDNETVVFNADATINKNLTLFENLRLVNLGGQDSKGIRMGFEGQEKLLISGTQLATPMPGVTLNRLHFGNISANTVNNTMTMLGSRIGIGTEFPSNTLDVKAVVPSGHVMKIENTAPGIEGDGLEIKLNRPANGAGNNFVTFTDQDGVAGRIEGFSITEDIALAAFPDIDITSYFDIVSFENLAFDPGSLPTLSGGQFPSLSGGTFPTFTPGTFPNFNPGSLPTLNPGTAGVLELNASFDAGLFIANVACIADIFCTNYQDFYTFNPTATGFTPPSLNPGVLPSLSGGSLPNLSGGAFPTFDPGVFPTISGGSLPSLDFDFIFDPTPIAGAFDDLKSVMCWAIENGERNMITTNFQDLKMMADISYLSNLADCKNGGVTYGSGGADYAEYLKREDFEEHIEAGQIVAVKGGKISKNTEEAEQLLVISMMPIILGNMPDDTASLELYEKVAFLGQAPVWVVGKVRSGDYIIPSGMHDGYGIAISPEDIGLEHISKIIGRAWSEGNRSVNLVNMIIGLKTNELSFVLNQFDKELDQVNDKLDRLESAILGLGLVSKE